ncbi:MAG: GEVED domain-containing protein, partial [Ignavibacteriales bacterium]
MKHLLQLFSTHHETKYSPFLKLLQGLSHHCIFLLAITLFPLTVSAQVRDIGRAVLNIPEIREPRDLAPGYCESKAGSKTFEYIKSVNVVEGGQDLLDITVEIYITNPGKCVAGKSCPTYDANPENVNVWIDWDGNNKWETSQNELVLDEHLKSYSIGFNNHIMTARRTGIKIPIGAKRPTWLRANLGWGTDPADPCKESWAYGDVKDYPVLWNLRVEKMDKKGAIDLKEFTIPKRLLRNIFDKDGKLLGRQENVPVIAAALDGSIKLATKLISFPADREKDSRTRCAYFITGEGIHKSDYAYFDGKEGDLEIRLPNKIGFYNLRLEFELMDKTSSIVGRESYEYPLWVSYKKPLLPDIKKIWIEKAIRFTEGVSVTGSAENTLAETMMNGIYSKGGMKWAYGNSVIFWYKLVEDEVQEADCKATANVWSNLLKVLGVGGTSTVHHQGKKVGIGFLTVKGLTAYGGSGSANGNAAESGILYPWDRWLFASHTFGLKSGKYYDPVFNKSSSDMYFHVGWDIRAEVNGWIETGDLPPNAGPSVRATGGAFPIEDGRWLKYYYVFGPKGIAYNIKKSSLANGAKFTGTFSERTINADGDAYADQLGAEVGVEITTPGRYSVWGALRQNNTVITNQPYDGSPAGWYEAIGPNTGKFTVNPVFSGESIYQKKT